MRKKAIMLILVLLSFLGLQAQGITLPYLQNFSALTSGSMEGTGTSGTAASASDLTGFTGLVKGFQAGGVLKLGSSGDVGSLTTDVFTATGTDVRVAFWAVPWTGASPKAAKVLVQYGSQSDTIDIAAATHTWPLTADDFTQYEVLFNSEATASSVTISTLSETGLDRRIFIDDLKISTISMGAALSEGFEDAAFPPEGWVTYKLSGTVSWERYTSSTPVGTASASVNYGTSSGNDNWLITPKMRVTAAASTLGFQAKVATLYSNTTLYIKVSTTGVSPTDFADTKLTLTDKVVMPNTLTTTWTAHTVDLSEYVGQSIYVAFHVVDNNGSRVMIDEITGPNVMPDVCARPATITASDITSNSATITWTDATGNSWIVENSSYADFSQDVNSQVVTGTPTLQLTGLVAGRDQYVRVKTDCGGGDFSIWKELTFATECGEVNPLNWRETFDRYTASDKRPECWTRVESYTSGSTVYPNVTTTASYCQDSEGGGMEMRASSSNLIVSPQFADSLSNSEVSFYVKYTISTTSTTTADAYFGVMSDPTDASTFIPLTSIIPDERSAWVNYTLSLAAVPSTHKYIAFQLTRGSGTPYIYIDNIRVYKQPTCILPTDFTLLDVTDSTAQITWIQPQSVGFSQWVVEYSEDEMFITDVQSMTSTDSVVTLTGLQDNTTYYVRVKADCGAEQSFWLNGSIRTNCVELDPLAWNESFENFATDNKKPDCWTRVVPYNSSITTTYPYVYTSALAMQDTIGGGLYMFVNNTNRQNLIASNRFRDSISESEISFWAKRSNANTEMTFGVMSDLEDTTTFLPVAVITPAETSVFEKFYVNLEGIADEYRYVAFKLDNQSTSTGNFYIDNIQMYPIPTCVIPTNVQVVADSLAPGTLNVSWSSQNNGQEQGYELAYRLYGTEDFTTVRVEGNVTTYSITGLQYGKFYDVQVRALCDTVEGDISNWVANNTGMTACGAVSMPWVYNFYDNDTLAQAGVNCMTILEGSGSYPSVTSISNLDPNSLYMYMGSSTDRLTVATPEFAEDLSNAWLKFWVKNSSSSNGTSHVLVGAMEDLSDTTTYMLVDSIGGITNTWTEYIVQLSSISNTHRYIVLSTVKEGVSYTTFYIDNLLIEEMPSCMTPTDVSVSGITTSDAAVSWTSHSEEYQWNVEYKAAADTAWTVQNVTNSPNAVITGLTPATYYDVRVMAVCDQTDMSEYSEVVTFMTLCTAVSSVNENFDSVPTTPSGLIPDCWSKITPHATYPSVVISSSANGLNTPSAKFQGTHPQFLVTPMFDRPLSELMLTFDLSREGEQSGIFQVGVMSDPADSTTFVPLANFDNNGIYKTLISHSLLFENVVDDGSNRFIAFRYGDVDGTTASTAWYYWIDNVVVDTLSDCVQPQSVQVLSYSENTADVLITPFDSTVTTFDYAISSDMTLTAPDASTTIAIVNSQQFTISGLQPNTEYQVWVRSACEGASHSPWTLPVTFRTRCLAMTQSIGYTETFDSVPSSVSGLGNIPECWMKISPHATYPSVVDASTSNGLSTPSVKFQGTHPQYLITQKMSEALSGLYLKFNLVREGASCGKFQVGVMSDPTDETTFIPVATMDNGTTYKQKVAYEVDFGHIVDDTTNRYIAFRYGDVTIDGITHTQATGWYYWVDDVEITAVPSCLRVGDISATNITTSSATVNFVSKPGQTAWQYLLVANASSLEADSTDVGIDITADSINLTGLNANTPYTIWVRTVCGTDEYSGWSPAYVFRTECGVSTIPYFESFVDKNPNDFNNAYCWTRVVDMSTSTTHYPYVYSSTSYSHDDIGSAMYFYLSSSNNLQMIASPEIANLNTAEASFWVKFASATSSYLGTMEFGTMSDLTDTATYVAIADVTPADRSTWVKYEIPLSNIPAGHKYIVFKGIWENSYPTFHLDEINLYPLPTCLKPTGLAVDQNSLTANYAEVTWTPSDQETSWMLYYKKSNATFWDSVVVNNTPMYTFTNLEEVTTYDLKIKAICSATDKSSETNVVSFTTPCGVETLPFVETFSSIVFPPTDCWSRSSTKADDLFNGSPHTNTTTGWLRSTTVMPSGGAKLNIYGTTRKYWLITPTIEISDTMQSVMLEFDVSFNKFNQATPPTGTCDDDKFIVAIGTDNGNTWTQANAKVWSNDGVGDYVLNDIPSTPYRYSIDISQHIGQNIKIGFYGESTVTGNGDNDIHIDSIVVKEVIIIPAQVTTLPATDITSNSATLNKTVVPGTYSIESEGFYYRQQNSADPRFTATLDGNVTGLNPGTIYEFFAYAVANGNTYYGDTLTFTTDGQASIPPTVTTLAATDITQTSAVLHKSVVADPSEAVTGEGWKYSIVGSNAWFDAPADGTLTGLHPDTTYQFYAYATTAVNPSGYPGDTLTFRTLAHISPVVVTGTATVSSCDAATITKTVTAGSEDIIAEGWKYRMESNPMFTDAPADGNLTALIPETRYYYFAYVTTATFPMVTGDTLSFTTPPCVGLDLAESAISIYPNPAKDEVSIEIDGLTADATATIYDMQGKAVGKYTIASATGKATVDVSTLADGTYMVRIHSKDINRVERLIIKR